jgi:hypothetical protein
VQQNPKFLLFPTALPTALGAVHWPPSQHDGV